MNLSSKQSASFANERNCSGVGSHVYFKTQLSQHRPSIRNQPISEFDVNTQQMISEDTGKYFFNPGWNNRNNGLKVCSQSVNNTKSWINQNTNYIHKSEMDWNPTSYDLVNTSNASGWLNDCFTSVNLLDLLEVDKSLDQIEFQTTSVLDAREVSGSSWSSCYNYDNNMKEDRSVTRSTEKSKLSNGVLWSAEGDQGFYAQRYLNATCQAPGYNERPFPTQTEGILWSNRHLFCLDAMKNQDNIPLGNSVNQVDFRTECSKRRCAEGDNLFPGDWVKNWKFRLLVDQKTETRIWAELQPYCSRLSDVIKLKYRFLGIPVEVEPCQYQPQDNINVKAFNIMFENSQDVSKAFNLMHNGELGFSLKEARPSPSYHVKYEVLNPVGVFKGKCFRQKWIHLLQKGDIVTANQLKANKIRIIKWCPAGGEIDFDLPGWVLLKTKDIRMLRRVDHRVENKINGKFESRSDVVSPLLLIQKIVGQHCGKSKMQVRHRSNPHRVSAANFSPFQVLVELEVHKGRREHAVIGRLKPGRVVWANQHKGSMLRIIKMDKRGNIVVDANLKPKNWGWVCLQRRGDVKPRLVRLPTSDVAKTDKFMNIRCSRDKLGSKDKFYAGYHTQHLWKKSRNACSRISGFAEENSRTQGGQNFKTLLLNDLEDCISRSRYSDEAKNTNTNWENNVGVSSSLSDRTSRIIAREERQKDNYVMSGMVSTVAQIREIENRISEASGEVAPSPPPSISVTMHSSSSECPMSTSVSPRPDLSHA